jgi:hypothetical protein
MVVSGGLVMDITRTEGYWPFTTTTHPYHATGIALLAVGSFLALAGAATSYLYDQRRKELLKK